MYKKITEGYVIQVFNDKHILQSQEFITGDDVVYEDENGNEIDAPEDENYEPFDMIQPEGY